MDIQKMQVKATARILKFAEGADPEKDAPIDVVTNEYIFKGEEAIKVLREQGIDVEEAIRLGIATQNESKGGNE